MLIPTGHVIKPKRNPFLRQEEQNQTTHRQTKYCAMFPWKLETVQTRCKAKLVCYVDFCVALFFIIEDNVINVKFVKLACIPKNQEVYYQYQKDRYLQVYQAYCTLE